MNPPEKQPDENHTKAQKPELTEEEIERSLARLHKLSDQLDGLVISLNIKELMASMESWDIDNNSDEDTASSDER